MTTHTQGPWHRGGKKGLIVYGPKGYPICSCDTHHGTHQEGQDEANARRIVACVNACEGISTENLEYNLPVKELAQQYNEAIRQRDELLAALEEIVQHTGLGHPIANFARKAIGSVKGGAA